uniref:General transcription factor IIIC, polypeptide 2, beta n=1 Tax=Fundulus heteroclitus TaxID=8078 RepID=A0A3Q2PBJ1_FUNHE
KSAGKRESSQKTPAKPRKTKTPEERAANGEKEPTPQTPADSAAQTALVTPKKPGRRKKTQLVTTPLTTAAAAAGDLPAGEAVQTSVQQENGTPKPKRKYVRKKPVEEIREPKEEPPAKAEEEVGGGGRSRRRAAKSKPVCPRVDEPRRFEATPAHPCLWDMFLFTGGPLWALEWCPTPDGAPASQYVALACHRRMDDLHCMNQTYCGAGLVQLWDCGKLEHHSRYINVKYAHQDFTGCVPKACLMPKYPKMFAPFLPRLGLLAAATSSGVVTIYSLPHPDALLNNEKPPIYKVGVVTLKLGCIKSPRKDNSGQVLSMDWLPQKPHNIMAIGFYDGIVGLWDLSTKSSLLRVRESDRSLTLLPYRYIAAHNHAVRTLAFCPASTFLLMTAGEDRYLKTWDLRRLCDMVKVQKRHQTTEICWPLGSPGVLIAEERASIGVHYIDHHLHSYFAIPRNTTVWSISYSDWLHSVLSSDTLGEVIISMLPLSNFNLINVKKTDMRRFVSQVELQANQEAHEGGSVVEGPHLQFQAYKDAVKKHYLHFKDLDMHLVTVFALLFSSLQARFNPNMSSHVWIASGGQAGLVRLHCARTLITPRVSKLMGEHQAQFRALYSVNYHPPFAVTGHEVFPSLLRNLAHSSL